MPDSYDVTMTVNVTLPKATAKQKKCAHKWKTTQKATCERAGLKTCKKCNLQKEIAKKPHAYEWKEVTIYHWEYLRTTRVCGNCRGENPWTYTSKQKILWVPNVSYFKTQGFYDVMEEIQQAALQHCAETGHNATHAYEEWEMNSAGKNTPTKQTYAYAAATQKKKSQMLIKPVKELMNSIKEQKISNNKRTISVETAFAGWFL